ncbi:MAG TPA: redox-regulated ATPase YchF [Syntrophaceae bacterium]|nr:redox-regulated ATPase YchF [Syntrophaceae bacterium]
MSLKCGIIGLPNVGKSTIFNALSRCTAPVASYPFTTIQPNVGIVPVPDKRLKQIASLTHHKKITPATIEFVDMAGLVDGASRGEGLGNQFLANIRSVDVLIHVIRCFKNDNVTHVYPSMDTERDIGVINTELILADLQVLERRIAKVKRQSKSGAKQELVVYEKLHHGLSRGLWASLIDLEPEEKRLLRELFLLTSKPVIYVYNVDENGLQNKIYSEAAEKVSKATNAPWVAICGDVESEIREFREEEQLEFLLSLGLRESGLDKLVKMAYQLLGLVTFYTIVGTELRAWPILAGTSALTCAGKVHSDMERGFIKTEVIAFDDFMKVGSMAKARAEGLIRLEGRDYIVQDGDILHFRFNL